MVNRSGHVSAVLTTLAAMATLLVAGARTSTAGTHFAILAGVSHWANLESLSLAAADDLLIPLEGFNATGFNLEIGAYSRKEMTEHSALDLGGELGIFWHRGGPTRTETNGLTGEVVDIEYATNAGHLTASVRYRLGGAGANCFYVGGGGGLYLLRMKEIFAGDVYELSQNSATPGGYLTAGYDIARGKDGSGAFRIESKLHLFSFGGADLQHQSVSGPLLTLAAGLVF